MPADPSHPTSINRQIARRPDILDISLVDDRDRFDYLLDGGDVFTVHDTLTEQLDDLIRVRHPQRKLEPLEMADERKRILGPTPEQFGRWVFYPWTGSLVRLLPPAEFRFLRTVRNRYKITPDEQRALATKAVGVVGLSVGLAAAVTLALEGIGGRFRLADFDTLGLSNLNRLRARVCDLGVNKAVLAARQLFEIDPYLDVEIFPVGIREESLAGFFGNVVPLDVLVEECDDLWAKVRLREEARGRRVPVVMDTSDRGMIDVERYDLDPTSLPFHGLAGAVRSEDVRAITPPARMGLIAAIVEADKLSPGARRSLPEIGETITTWPQLASAVALGGAVTADVVRRIPLGTFTASGRFRVDVEQLVCDHPHPPMPPPGLRILPTDAFTKYDARTHGHGGRASVVSY